MKRWSADQKLPISVMHHVHFTIVSLLWIITLVITLLRQINDLFHPVSSFCWHGFSSVSNWRLLKELNSGHLKKGPPRYCHEDRKTFSWNTCKRLRETSTRAICRGEDWCSYGPKQSCWGAHRWPAYRPDLICQWPQRTRRCICLQEQR